MFPEAGGSSSFARRAFNEFWSFFAAWGQMLTYIITIAISAFFVPHYLGVFWDPLGESPADIVAGIILVVLLGALNIVGVKESAGVNIGFAVADFMTQVLLVIVGIVLVFDPDLLVRQIDLGTTPTVEQLPDRDPGRDGRLHRHRDDLEHGRGGARLRQDDPARDRPGGRRRGGDLHVPARGGAVGDAGEERRDAPGAPEGGGRLRRRPGARRGREHGPRLAPAPGPDLRRHPRGHDPVHRHERRHPRRLAAQLLDGPAPPAPRDPAGAPPALPHAVHRDRRLQHRRVRRHPAGPGRLPRGDLRLRRDALVHDRARVGDDAAGQAPGRQAALEGPRQHPDPRLRAARCSRFSAGSARASR